MLHKTLIVGLLNFLRYVPCMSLTLIQQFSPQQTKYHTAASSSAALRNFFLRATCICGSKKKQWLLFATTATTMHTRKLQEGGGGSNTRTMSLQIFSKLLTRGGTTDNMRRVVSQAAIIWVASVAWKWSCRARIGGGYYLAVHEKYNLGEKSKWKNKVWGMRCSAVDCDAAACSSSFRLNYSGGAGGQPPRYSWKLIGSPWYMQDVEVSDWG